MPCEGMLMSRALLSPGANGPADRLPSSQSPDGHDARPAGGVHYKWIALSNTTLGMLMATINASILLIALPDI